MEKFEYRYARQFAAQHGFLVALLWMGSFLCWAYSLDYVLLGPLSLCLGIGSIFLTGITLMKYNNEQAPLTLLRSTWMAWLIFLYAGLLTTLGQFVYFQYFDHGHLANGMEQSLLMPENEPLIKMMLSDASYQQVFAQLFPDQDVAKWTANDFAGAMGDAMRSISARDIAIQTMLMNFLIATFFALPCGLMGIIKKKQNKTH